MSKLRRAIQTEDEDLVAQLLDEKQVVTVDARGRGILHEAIEVGNLNILQMLTECSQVDPNTPDRVSGWSPLVHAVVVGNDISLLRPLIDAKVNLESKNAENGYTALHFAAKLNKVDCVKALITAGSNIDAIADKLSETPLVSALLSSSIDAASILIQSGASLTHKTNQGSTPLHIAIEQELPNTAVEMFEHIRSPGNTAVDENSFLDKDGNSPLHIAYEMGLTTLIPKLIAVGFSTDRRNNLGQLPLEVYETMQRLENEEKANKQQEKEANTLRKRKEAEETMRSTEIGAFCQTYGLPTEVLTLLYNKKHRYVDEDFLTLNEHRLTKYGLDEQKRKDFFQAVSTYKREVATSRAKALAIHHRDVKRRQKQVILGVCVTISLLFLGIFFFFRHMESASVRSEGD